MAASLKMAQVDSLVSAPSPACIHTTQDGAEYWDIVQHRIYPEGPYVYISAATSFLKGRVKGSWHRGKDTTSRYNRITFHSKIYWKTLLSACLYRQGGDTRGVPLHRARHQQEVAAE